MGNKTTDDKYYKPVYIGSATTISIKTKFSQTN